LNFAHFRHPPHSAIAGEIVVLIYQFTVVMGTNNDIEIANVGKRGQVAVIQVELSQFSLEELLKIRCDDFGKVVAVEIQGFK
jgi:hypothetical protein